MERSHCGFKASKIRRCLAAIDPEARDATIPRLTKKGFKARSTILSPYGNLQLILWHSPPFKGTPDNHIRMLGQQRGRQSYVLRACCRDYPYNCIGLVEALATKLVEYDNFMKNMEKVHRNMQSPATLSAVLQSIQFATRAFHRVRRDPDVRTALHARRKSRSSKNTYPDASTIQHAVELLEDVMSVIPERAYVQDQTLLSLIEENALRTCVQGMLQTLEDCVEESSRVP